MNYLTSTVNTARKATADYVYTQYVEPKIIIAIQIAMFKIIISSIVQLTIPQTSFIVINVIIAFIMTKIANNVFGKFAQSEYLQKYEVVREFILKTLGKIYEILTGPYAAVCTIVFIIVVSHLIVFKTQSIILSMILELTYGYMRSVPIRSIYVQVEGKIADASTERMIRKIPSRLSQKDIELEEIDSKINIEFEPISIQNSEIDKIVESEFELIFEQSDLTEDDFIEL